MFTIVCELTGLNQYILIFHITHTMITFNIGKVIPYVKNNIIELN